MNEAFDSFRVEEAYAWQDDIMEITRRIVYETDEARLSNIADHFKVDLSEIREFIEMKRLTKRKAITNADRIRAMSDEELAIWISHISACTWCPAKNIKTAIPCKGLYSGCKGNWLDWLKQDEAGG